MAYQSFNLAMGLEGNCWSPPELWGLAMNLTARLSGRGPSSKIWRCSWSRSDVPGNSGLPVSNSACRRVIMMKIVVVTTMITTMTITLLITTINHTRLTVESVIVKKG